MMRKKLHKRVIPTQFPPIDKARQEATDSTPHWKETSRKVKEKGAMEDKGAYLPGPKEIQRRVQNMRWLYTNLFSERFIYLVMRDKIPLNRVVHLVKVEGMSANEIETLFKRRGRRNRTRPNKRSREGTEPEPGAAGGPS